MRGGVRQEETAERVSPRWPTPSSTPHRDIPLAPVRFHYSPPERGQAPPLGSLSRADCLTFGSLSMADPTTSSFVHVHPLRCPPSSRGSEGYIRPERAARVPGRWSLVRRVRGVTLGRGTLKRTLLGNGKTLLGNVFPWCTSAAKLGPEPETL